ncbi:hypothetical protein VKT23_014659 [Stygiomarasmius scandens]|uniref:Uncharacterized protein n=1 Tax=Marasmiellus scandens TaxID=2682957 RepID=A0ABR1J2P0_9AGAR
MSINNLLVSNNTDSTALILHSRNNPLTLLEDVFGVNSLISAFLKSIFGASFYPDTLPSHAIMLIDSEDGPIQYAFTKEFADNLWEKVGVVISILSGIIGQGGSYPNPINAPISATGPNFITDLANVTQISVERFPDNPFYGIRAVSVQGLQQCLAEVNFVLVQYCHWVYTRVRTIVREGGNLTVEIASILLMPYQVVDELTTPYIPSESGFIQNALEAGGAPVM